LKSACFGRRIRCDAFQPRRARHRLDQAERAAMPVVDGDVLETRSQARRGQELVADPALEGEIDARHLIEVVEDHQPVVSSTSAIPLASSRLLSVLPGSRRNSFSSRASSSFRLMYHPLCHMVHSSTGESPLEAP
jgi:hypothetical protein